jgi:membrane fusion protein, multidrug efflux system
MNKKDLIQREQVVKACRVGLLSLGLALANHVSAFAEGQATASTKLSVKLPARVDASQDTQPVFASPSNSRTLPINAIPRQSGNSVADGNVVRGVVRAYETATISAELNAKILSLPFRDGDRFKQGDLLVQFDCERLDAETQATAAAHQAHAIAYDNQLRLQKYKAAGNSAVQQSRHESQKAAAEFKALLARQKSCRISAPFSGRVVERTANAYEIAQPNQPLLKIVNDSRLELVLMVPSNRVATLRAGMGFTFRIDETGENYPAKITQIGGAIEPISQSVRIVGEIASQVDVILLGMSGSALLSPGTLSR